jgi:hypothetical protein
LAASRAELQLNLLLSNVVPSVLQSHHCRLQIRRIRS